MALNLPLRKITTEGWWPNSYDVLVYQEGGHYYAKDRNGNVICADTPTACLQESVQLAKLNGGGKILIKRGEYNVSQTIDLGEGDLKLTIEGEDMFSTVISPASDIAVFKAVATSANAGVRMLTIRNLRIRGNSYGTGVVLGASQQNVLQYAALITIERVFFDSLKQSIYANNLWISKISDVISNGGVAGGPPVIQLDQNGSDTSHDVYIVRLYAENNKARPISIPARAYNIVIQESFIDAHNNVDYLIYMDPTSYYNIVANSYLAGATSYAIYASPGTKITSNLIWYCSGGIYSMGGVIVGNRFAEIPNDAIYVVSSPTYVNLVENNTIQFVGRGVRSEADQVLIIGNRFYNISNQAVWINYRTGNIIVGNSVYEAQTSGGVAIIDITGQFHVIKDNYINSSKGTHAIAEGDGNNNVIEGNSIIAPKSILWVGPNTIVKDNIGYITVKSSTATIASGSTSVTVSHGMSCTPRKVFITPLAQPSGQLWVSDITNTSFIIRISSAPSANLPVAWYAEC